MRLFLAAFFISLTAHGQNPIHTIPLKFGTPVAGAAPAKEMQALLESYNDEKWADCLQGAKKAFKKNNDVKGWIYAMALRCHYNSYLATKKTFPAAEIMVGEVWKDKEGLLGFGASAKALRVPLIDLTFVLIEQNPKGRTEAVWKWLDQLLAVTDWMDATGRAKLYRLAGEQSLAQQNLTLAKNYFERSLNEQADSKVLARLESLNREAARLGEAPKLGEIAKSEEVAAGKSGSESSPDENEIYKRMEISLQNKDFIAAVEDGMKLVKDYSGGKKAQAATKNILSVYLTLAARTEDKFQNLKDDVLAKMQKADGQRLYDWATTMSNREYYEDAVKLTEKSIEQLGGQALSTKVLLLCAQSAVHIGDFKKARIFFSKLIREHAGTRAAGEAIYRTGLMDYRQKQYAEAMARFEQFLATEHSEDFDLSSLYWLWRATQKLTPDKAAAAAERLINKYPVSYYGLRARAELASGQLKFEKELAKSISYSLNLTSHENAVWQRFTILLKSGWYPEAQAELATLPEPLSGPGVIVFSQLWSESRNFLKAAELLYKSYQQDPTLITLSTLRLVYPQEHLDIIQKESARYKIPPELILGLIKQESSFDANAKSPVGAMGLMQLMTATARELASDLKIKISDIQKDVKEPQVNIRLGTQYLHRRLKYFDGYVPLALAAYNAGIGNVRSWLKVRQDLKDFYKSEPKSYDDELWFDELPWTETSGYIKSILRNFLVYQLLDQGEITLSDPIWKFGQKKI